MRHVADGQELSRITELLEASYRSDGIGDLSDLLSECLFVLLAPAAQEPTYAPLFAFVRRMYPRWLDVLAAPRDELCELLGGAGLDGSRVDAIRDLLAAVLAENRRSHVGPAANPMADLTLAHLNVRDPHQAKAFLATLPGLDGCTAERALAFSRDREVVADSHVRRIFARLGMSRAGADDFNPAAVARGLRVNLIHHARAVCTAPNPMCERCVLVSFCQLGRARSGTSDMESPTAVDLFAGAGGLSRGFQQAGWRIALAVELDRNAAQTYRLNNPGVPVAECDVAGLTGADVRTLAAGAHRVNAVLAGPPCQGYSAAGRRIPTDEKNQLFRHVTRIAQELHSEFLCVENVTGLLKVGGETFNGRILASMRRRGYRSAAHVLDARMFGVAQRRKRIVFLGRRVESGRRAPPSPPAAPAADTPDGLLRALDGLPPVAAGFRGEWIAGRDGSALSNVSTMDHSDRVIEKISKISLGTGPISYRRLGPDAAGTLIAGHRALPVHPVLNRTISVREAARIQGFDDDYVFLGPRAEQPLQVANAVPPPLAAAVGRLLSRLHRQSYSKAAAQAS